MKIPEGYRRVGNEEKMLATDYIQWAGKELELIRSAWVDCRPGGAGFSWEDGNNWQILRKQTSPWVAMSERIPGEADGDEFVFRYPDNSYNTMRLGSIQYAARATHWMKIPSLPKPIAPPITIFEGTTSREIEFRKDGSIKVGCVEVSKEKLEEILVRRGEVMKT